jgi:hypothetical protein
MTAALTLPFMEERGNAIRQTPPVPVANMDLIRLGAKGMNGVRTGARRMAHRTAQIACGSRCRDQVPSPTASRPEVIRTTKAEAAHCRSGDFVRLYRRFPSLVGAAVIFKPETLVRWHRSGFRLYWRWKSRRRAGRPAVPADIRGLIRAVSRDNRQLVWTNVTAKSDRRVDRPADHRRIPVG